MTDEGTKTLWDWDYVLAWYVWHSPSDTAVFVKTADGVDAQGGKLSWCFSYICPLLLRCTVQEDHSWILNDQIALLYNALQHHTPRCLYNYQCSNVWFGIGTLVYELSVNYFTQSHPAYCVFTYLPCWVVLPSSDSPSICLSRLMNGRKSICFLWRWWPTAATQREEKWML